MNLDSNIKLFGTDGVRGRVGEVPITPDVLVRLGFVAGQVLCASHESPQVLISKDTRLSGYMVESALEAGFSAAGVDVLLSGPLPTSAVSYLTQTLRLAAGVVISASHNPHNDNGVKFFGADGRKLPAEIENKIEEGMKANKPITFDGNPGKARRLDAAADRYIEFCKRGFPSQMSLHGMRILVDCANGAAYHVAPPVLHELGAEVLPFANQPDGMNINVDCGVMAPQAAADKAREENANVAIILDGDADRVFLADELGKIYDGDALLYLIAKWRYRTDSSTGVVGTSMSNLSLERSVKMMGMDFYRADVGDRHVLQALTELKWRIGGEPSGHIVLSDLHCTGDGIIAALSVLSIMCESQQPLSVLMAGYFPCPQYHKSVEVADRKGVLESSSVKHAMDDTKRRLGRNGRIVVRASGTEQVIRVMVEADAANLAWDALGEIVSALEAA